MTARFRNRIEAGRRLAGELRGYAGRADVLVLALPRGGVPVGFEVARALGVPLDVFVVRKLGVPGQEELALGALASGGIQVLNEEVVTGFDVRDEVIAAIAARERRELERRERLYRAGRPPPVVRGKTVILCDDGVATGATMFAAIRALRGLEAKRIVVAVPTAAPSTARALRKEADAMVAVLQPEDFSGVGQWYEDFAQTADEEVCALLNRAQAGNAPQPQLTP